MENIFFIFYFNFVKMENMIEDNVRSTPALPFLTNSRVDIVGFVNIVRRNVFSEFLKYMYIY